MIPALKAAPGQPFLFNKLNGGKMNKEEIASIIDHTNLAPNVTSSKIEKLCKEADENHFASVCINPSFVPLASELLKESSVKVCTVIGFPLGAVPTEDKVHETTLAIENGADEVDMVIDISAALDGRMTVVGSDIAGVVQAARKAGEKAGKKIIVKVILETCYLDDKTIVDCCLLAKNAGADFVKTSTGFGTPKGPDGSPLPNGATEHHVSIMRTAVGSNMGVKASGGIRDAMTAGRMVMAGASRIGTSSGVAILETWQ